MARNDRLTLIAALAAVYVVWGSTYLAIRYAIETIPPFLMASVRFLLAGLALVLWSRSRGAAWPTAVQWRTAAIVGSLLLLGGNGGVVWAEQSVPSSLVALVVAAVPLFTAIFEWLQPGGRRPDGATGLGLVAGFVGVALLLNPGARDAARVDVLGAAALLGAALSWSAGSIYSRRARGADSPLMAAGANMLLGGAGLAVAAAVTGELAALHTSAITLRSVLALVYLILFGSLVGFTAYTWLLRNTTPARATTYAYVNPVVAIVLGWAVAGEPLTPRILIGAAIILAGVITITALPQIRVGLQGWRARGPSRPSTSRDEES